jgi:hypothetical protein
MSNEEKKSDYYSVDSPALNEKIMGTMLVMAMSAGQEDAPEKSFDHIKESYSFNELVLIASLHIGETLRDNLQRDPKFLEVVRLMRQASDLSKRMDNNGKPQN